MLTQLNTALALKSERITTSMNDEIRLAPPGAGLPPLELWASRIGFGILRNTLSRRRIEDWLRNETSWVLAISGELSPEQMKREVLIPRLTGLERGTNKAQTRHPPFKNCALITTGLHDKHHRCRKEMGSFRGAGLVGSE
jgi:hypothetical protein